MGMMETYNDEDKWKVHIQWLMSQDLCHIALLVQDKFSYIKKAFTIPTAEDIFTAMANDHRERYPNSSVNVNNQRVVPIYVLVDEHQLMFEVDPR